MSKREKSNKVSGETAHKTENSAMRTALRVLAMAGLSCLALVFVVVFAIMSVIWVLVKGPSPTAQRLFVMSVQETSAIGWLAGIYLSQAEIDEIMNLGSIKVDDSAFETDTSLITLPSPASQHPSGGADAEEPGNDGTDVDTAEPGFDNGVGDGLEFVEITGNGYRGYMLIVDDPLRIFVGTPQSFGGTGETLEKMIERTEAVAGINGGGFDDPDGRGRGGTPDGIIITSGNLEWGSGGYSSVIGFDADGILHVGAMSSSDAVNLNLQWACSFGPALVSNGSIIEGNATHSGINPRTAIGQRADGAVLMLVVDGRQFGSLGATLRDLAEIMLDFGAVNAANLDGGSSSQMILYGETVNTPSSVAGPRFLPSAFLVRPQE